LDDAFGLDEPVRCGDAYNPHAGPRRRPPRFVAAVAFPKAADPDPTKWQPENSAEHLACETEDGAREGERKTTTSSPIAAAMGKGPSSRAGSRHQQFRARAMTRVDDLQEVFSGLQSARKDSRPADAAVLEAQLQQMLREWRSELSAPSPASSLQVLSLLLPPHIPPPSFWWRG